MKFTTSTLGAISAGIIMMLALSMFHSTESAPIQVAATPQLVTNIVNSLSINPTDFNSTQFTATTSDVSIKSAATVTNLSNSGLFTSYIADTATATVVETIKTDHQTTGTPAAGFGSRFSAYSQTTDGTSQRLGYWDWYWNDATTATRKTDMKLKLAVVGAAVYEPIGFKYNSALGRHSVNIGNVGTVGDVADININGSVALSHTTLTTNSAAINSSGGVFLYYLDTTNLTQTIPTATGNAGKTFTFFNMGVATNTIATGGGNINGSATYTLSGQYKYVTVHCNGLQWYVIRNN